MTDATIRKATTEKMSNDRAKELFGAIIRELEQRDFTIDETMRFFAWFNEMMLTGCAVNSANEFVSGGGDAINGPKVGLITIERYRRLMEISLSSTQQRYIEGMLALGFKVTVLDGHIEVTDVRGKEN